MYVCMYVRVCVCLCDRVISTSRGAIDKSALDRFDLREYMRTSDSIHLFVEFGRRNQLLVNTQSDTSNTNCQIGPVRGDLTRVESLWCLVAWFCGGCFHKLFPEIEILIVKKWKLEFLLPFIYLYQACFCF